MNAEAAVKQITADPAPMVAPISVVKSLRPKVLAKTFRLVDGALVKQSAGEMTDGLITTVDASSPAELADVIRQLEADNALVFGIPKKRDAQLVVTAAQLEKMQKAGSAQPGTIARTKDAFEWHAGAGVMALDYDPPKGAAALSPAEWREALYSAAPALREAPCVWTVSSSSAIWNSETGEELSGITGQRLYVFAADARDIPRAGKVLFDRLWLAGHGYIVVGSTGALLTRASIDEAMFQENRLDFAAAPVCESPLGARRPDPQIFNNDAPPLDTRAALPDLTDAEKKRLGDMQGRAKADPEVQAKREAAQSAKIEQELDKAELEALESGQPLTEEQREHIRERVTSAVKRRVLFGDFELLHSSGKIVTVAEALDNPDRWHNQRWHDPLEPEYSNGDKRIAWLNLRSGGSPHLYSHAHGGQRFRLLRATRRLDLDGGEDPRAVQTICERLRVEGDVYERAGGLVRLADGELIAVETAWLQLRIEQSFELHKYDARSNQNRRVGCPESLAKKVQASRGAWKLPKVSGVITSPVIRTDGSLLSEPGLDEATGLLFVDDRQHRPIPRALEHQALREALQRIWHPFHLFPFTDDLSRGVFLSALLTTVCRPALDTAPAWLVRAHAAGTGKTRLCECLMDLVGASRGALPLPESPDEVEKRLFAKLLAGRPGILLDNLKGRLDSAALCAFMTSAAPEGRILGHSRVITARNAALWTLSGNNVVADGDTFRRILPVTLDAGTESPETRRFPFDPRDVIASRIEDYRADVLSVLLSFVAAGMPQDGAGSIGSFEQWERLVRQCVVWLIAQQVVPAPMADPADVIKLSRAEDPARVRYAALLQAWFDLYGTDPVRVDAMAALVQRGATMTGNAAQDEREHAFIEAAREVAEIRGTFNKRSFGWYLRNHRGVVTEGMRVDQDSNAGGRARWRVSRVAEAIAA